MKTKMWFQLLTASLLIAETSAQTDLLGTLVSVGFSVFTEATSLLSSAASAASVASVASANGLPASTRATTTSRSSSSRTSTSSASRTSSSLSSLSSSSELASSASASAASLASAASSASVAAASATNAAGTNNGSNGGGKNNRLAIILGSVLGALALGLLLLVLLLCCRKRRRGRRSLRSTSPTDREVGAWAGKHATAAPPIVHNKTEVAVNAPPPGNGLPMSQHPGTAGNGMDHNPFVPVPPAPRKSAPNARHGLTDAAVPGDDPYLTEKGTSRPITPRKSYDNSHKGGALAAGAGGAALGAAAMHHHNKHDGSNFDNEKHGLPVSSGPNLGSGLHGPRSEPFIPQDNSVGPGAAALGGAGLGATTVHPHGHHMGSGVAAPGGRGPELAASHPHGHHIGPGTAALGGAGLGAAAAHHHSKNYNGHLGNEQFHTPPMIPGSQTASPPPLGHNRPMAGTLATTPMHGSNVNRMPDPTPLQQHRSAQNEALAGVGGAAIGAAATPNLHRGNASFIDENRHDALFGDLGSNTIPNSSGTTLINRGPQDFSSNTSTSYPASGLPQHSSSNTGTALAAGAGGAALSAAAMHHHNRHQTDTTTRRNFPTSNTEVTQPSQRPMATTSGVGPDEALPSNHPAVARNNDGGPFSSHSGHTGPVAAGLGGLALGSAATKHQDHDGRPFPDRSVPQNNPPSHGASSSLTGLPSSRTNTLLPSTTSPSTGLSSTNGEFGGPNIGTLPAKDSRGTNLAPSGTGRGLDPVAIASSPHDQIDRDRLLHPSQSLVQPTSLQRDSRYNDQPSGTVTSGTPDIGVHDRAMMPGAPPVPQQSHIDRSMAPGNSFGYQPNLADDRRYSLRSDDDGRIGRKPVPVPIVSQSNSIPTPTSNDDAFALNKNPARRSGESARKSHSRDASRANAVFDNEYSQRPVSSHGATAAAMAAAAGATGGSALAQRRPNSQSRSPHRRSLLRSKERTSDTSSSSNDYTDALPGPNPFGPPYGPRPQSGVQAAGATGGSNTVLPTDIPPAPLTRSRHNSALGTAAPPAAVNAYQNHRNRSQSRSRSTSSEPDLPPVPSRSPKRNSFSNVPFDTAPVNTPSRRYVGQDKESFFRDTTAPPMPTYPPNATPLMPADLNAPPGISTAERSLVGDNGYPHMGIPRRKSSGAYDLERYGPLGPPSISPPTDKNTSGETSDDSSWRLSSGMPGGWRRAEGRTASLTSNQGSSGGGGGVTGARSPLGRESSSTESDDALLNRGISRDSGISGISGSGPNGGGNKRLRAGDLRGGRRSEEISRSGGGGSVETPEQMMARGRQSVEHEWTGNGGYDGYMYYHPDDMHSHHVGTAM